jgi:hypothetical protein
VTSQNASSSAFLLTYEIPSSPHICKLENDRAKQDYELLSPTKGRLSQFTNLFLVRASCNSIYIKYIRRPPIKATLAKNSQKSRKSSAGPSKAEDYNKRY